jgi:hypothetical protein
MAKNATKVDLVDDTDAQLQEQAEELARLNQASGGDLFNVTDELRAAGISGVVCLITRNHPVEKKGYCGTLSIAEFTLEKMRVTFGAGRYMVQIKGPKGFLPGGGPVEIAESVEPTKPATGGDFQSFLEAQARRDAERSSKLWELAMISVPALIAGFFNRQPSNDIAGLVTALKPAPGPTLADLSGTLVNMKALAAPEKSESQVDVILKVFEAAQNLMGGEGKDGAKGEGSNWVDVIRDLIKAAPDALKPVLEARMAAMQAQRGVTASMPAQNGAPAVSAPRIPTPAPTVAATPAANGAADESKGNDMRALWEPIAKQHLSKVVGWAQKDLDPAACAEVFVGDLPDLSAYLSVDQVLEYLDHPQWFEKVCELEPRLSAAKQYCDEMRLEMIEIVKQIKKDLEEEKPNAPTEGHQES